MGRQRSLSKRKTYRRRRVPRSLPTQLVASRIFQADILKVASDTGLYRTFQPLLFSISDLIGMFQCYRIRSIKVEYQLYNQLNNNSSFPTLYIAPQYWTESTTPSSISEVGQFQGVKVFQFGPSRPTYTQTFIPRVNMSSTGPGRTPVASPWLSTTSDLPQHLTHVEWIQNYNTTSAPTHTIRLVATAVFEFRGTR